MSAFVSQRVQSTLSGSLWGIAAYFNPQKYRNKLENYQKFRDSSRRQGLKLITVELAFSDSPFELTGSDAEVLKQVRSSSILWQKECLLNLALKELPSDCDKVAWLDADVLFANSAWVEETCLNLQKYRVVQPYDYAIRLPQGVSHLAIESLSEGSEIGQRQPSAAFNLFRGINQYGHTGYAWAARREILQEIGFFDKMILGSGDNLISDAFCVPAGIKPCKVYSYLFGELRAQALAWQRMMSVRVAGEVGHTSGAVFHLFHGSRRERRYLSRLDHLRKYDFHPDRDIRKNSDGCWEWSSEKSELHAWVRNYFWYRNEEGSPLRSLHSALRALPLFPMRG